MGLFKIKIKKDAEPIKETAKAEPEKKAPSVKAVKAEPEKKPVAKAPAKAPTKAPTKNKTASVSKPAAKPFFAATTEDDVRSAFDAAIAEAEAEINANKAKAIGKYEFGLEVDGYHFYLIANNGQVLFDSPSFTTLLGALSGLKTFKKTVGEGKFEIKVDKYNRYRFILARKYYGENYASKDQCQKAVESVKNFAVNAKIIRYTPDKDEIKAYEKEVKGKNPKYFDVEKPKARSLHHIDDEDDGVTELGATAPMKKDAPVSGAPVKTEEAPKLKEEPAPEKKDDK
jgi:uncharacterized protein YegP (UPF0339 family)